MGITRRLRNYFLRGMAVLLPTMLTIWIFIWGYRFIQDNISIHINRGLVRLIESVPWLLTDWSQESLVKFWVDGYGAITGFVIALIFVIAVGVILASVVGKTLWRTVEKFIMNTPFLRQVYPYVKQITDFVFTQEQQKKFFSRVVAVEYPRKGIWSIGMVTGAGLKKVSDNTNEEMLAVLIPTSPTPFTGFVIMVAQKETIELDITIEEALRFIVSGGVIAPGNELETESLSQIQGSDE
ncbi:MAG: DUF502 domain-containing protein [Planctomycetota bacterium]|jgi:uncharacterized membrane protein